MQSPIYRAIWENEFPVEQFSVNAPPENKAARQVMANALNVVQRHRANKTINDSQGRIQSSFLNELAESGYWGLRVDPRFGGSGASFQEFVPFLTRMATIDSAVAGLASVHSCLGAVNSLQAFGTEAQRSLWLPRLANGSLLSAFALTEPNAGTDLTALATTATREGDSFFVTGEKRFITNAAPGRLINLVCLVEGRPQVLLVELPQNDSDSFSFVDYDLHVQRRMQNRGLRFNRFQVPAANLLVMNEGNGLSIAYHGLNRGRMALCATAAGSLRVMLAGLVPWTKQRITYGAPLADRELVQARLGRLAALIVGCDALSLWCASLLDAGQRAELECIVAKCFAADAQREAAIDIVMKTQGGRSFVRGHRFGDHIHEFLVPGIYEGESEVLGLAFFRSLAKQHAEQYWKPVELALRNSSTAESMLFSPARWWSLRYAGPPYAFWLIKELIGNRARPQWPDLPDSVAGYAEFAAHGLRKMALEISDAVRHYGSQWLDRQCRVSEIASRIQKLTVLLCVALHCGKSEDPLVVDAADALCQRLIQEILGLRPTDAYFARITQLGEKIAAGDNDFLSGVPAEDLIMPPR